MFKPSENFEYKLVSFLILYFKIYRFFITITFTFGSSFILYGNLKLFPT